MKYQLFVDPEAKADIRSARKWYRDQLPGLELEFLESIDQAFDRLVLQPTLYARIHDDLRRVLTPRFPYGIFYLIEGSTVVVLAVLHEARDPALWQKRFRARR